MKQLWMLVGGNGAGKNTFYRLYLKPRALPFVNADELAKSAYPDAPEQHSYEAARLAQQICSRLIQQGSSFCFETVFSHSSKIDFIAVAKAQGYQIVLVVIHVEHSAVNRARVAQRVEEGGHAVPDHKVEEQIPRTLANVKMALPLCDEVQILDNSRADNPFKRIASIQNGVVTLHARSVPAWAEIMLSHRLQAGADE